MFKNTQNTAASNLITLGEAQREKGNTQNKQKNTTPVISIQFAYCTSIIAVMLAMVLNLFLHAT